MSSMAHDTNGSTCMTDDDVLETCIRERTSFPVRTRDTVGWGREKRGGEDDGGEFEFAVASYLHHLLSGPSHSVTNCFPQSHHEDQSQGTEQEPHLQFFWFYNYVNNYQLAMKWNKQASVYIYNRWWIGCVRLKDMMAFICLFLINKIKRKKPIPSFDFYILWSICLSP